ncbi:hypothetical protein DFH28DRAFT_1105269 [Melampsora americana]|nr:hypothetical protein DFH28DRAFT_1105269 [Melampsora americana]
MKGSINQIIRTCIMVQWLYFFNPTSFMHGFGMEDTESLCNIDEYYPRVWYKPHGSPEPSARERLISYLEQTLEERENSDPFFACPPALDDDLPGVGALNLMNTMLKSQKEMWPKHIQDVFKTSISYKMMNFRAFISEIADFMPTPDLQKTLFEMSKEKAKLAHVTEPDPFFRMMVFSAWIPRYADKLKEHVDILERKKSADEMKVNGELVEQEKYDKLRISILICNSLLIVLHLHHLRRQSKEVIDIFTRDQQENLGEHGIHLEQQWSPGEEVELYKNWASHMSVYMQVEGTLKGILETQAIQVRLIKLDRRFSLSIPEAQDEIGQALEHWMKRRYQALTRDLVDYIQSTTERSLLEFRIKETHYHQYGICGAWAYPLEDVRKVLTFWASLLQTVMPFYMDLKSHQNKWDSFELMEKLILNQDKDPDLYLVMTKFITVQTSFKPHEKLVDRFLKFLLQETKSEILKGMAQDSLRRTIKERNPSKKRRIT